jgi:hypothetical protein
MAMSDLLGVHVRGEKKIKIADPRSQENLIGDSRFSADSQLFLGKWQRNELEIQNYEEHIKRKHAQCPDGVKKQLNMRNIVFGAPTSICGAQLQPLFFRKDRFVTHLSNETTTCAPACFHVRFTCKQKSSRAKQKVANLIIFF